LDMENLKVLKFEKKLFDLSCIVMEKYS
jgi:hypothetical protein